MGYATTYEPEMRKSEHGRRLYDYWRNVHRNTDCEQFETFPGFYNWAMDNGYTIGARLFRYDPDDPFNPDNCFWGAKGEKSGQGKLLKRDFLREKQWDDFVNRIRRYYGMEPIHSTDTL